MKVGNIVMGLRSVRGNRGVDANVIVTERISGGGVGRSGVPAGPVVGDFVVVECVEPRKGAEEGEGPGWGGIYTAVFGAVVGSGGREAQRDVDVDEVAKEEHELSWRRE